jgi:putative hemolysin
VMVTNLMNIFAIALVTEELVAQLGNLGYLVTLGLFLPVYLIGLELLPKSLFRRFPYRALATLAEPLRIADSLLAPLHLVGRLFARTVFKHRPVEQKKLFVAREEFKYLTIESERTGALSPAERQMIHNVVDFRAITAHEVMVPIAQIHSVSADVSVDELVEKSRRSNIDRWPVMSDSKEIVGLVNVFDIALERRARGTIDVYQRRIVKVTLNEPAYTVLRKLRAARSTMAAVVGNDGKTLGVVTWEALIKRLVNTAAA